MIHVRHVMWHCRRLAAIHERHLAARSDEPQRRELMQALRSGALAEGFPTDLWTLPRVGKLIERRFARAYSESQVWRILVSLGFSCQRPSGRALERDETAIKRWKQTRWPVLKKTLQNKAESSSS